MFAILIIFLAAASAIAYEIISQYFHHWGLDRNRNARATPARRECRPQSD